MAVPSLPQNSPADRGPVIVCPSHSTSQGFCKDKAETGEQGKAVYTAEKFSLDKRQDRPGCLLLYGGEGVDSLPGPGNVNSRRPLGQQLGAEDGE